MYISNAKYYVIASIWNLIYSIEIYNKNTKQQVQKI